MRKNLALIVGGYSNEHEISVKSGSQVAEYIDKNLYEVYTIIIDKTKWYYINADNTCTEIDRADFSLPLKAKTIKFDVVFNMIHGTPGEDGKLQGYFDLLHIPYTGNNMFTAAATFNKYFCKSMVSSFGVPVAKSVIINTHNCYYDVDEIINKLGLPCFVKPNKNGSSVGITKAHDKEELQKAIVTAFQFDDEVLIEEFIQGREFSCGVFNNKGINVVLPVSEIIPKNEFFDYEAKYNPSKCSEVTPADIDENTAIAISAYTNLIYESLNCNGVVRIDYIANDNQIVFLEVNGTPGMSRLSIVPQQLKFYGMDFTEFLSIIIEEAFVK